MAIAFDNAVGGEDATTGTTHTLSLTVGSGSDRYLLVGITTFNSSGGNKVSGITYAGVAMTQIGAAVAAQSNEYLSMWYLANPATGTNNIVATFSSQAFSWMAGASYSGVAQTAPEVSSSGNGVGVTETGTVITLTDNAWTVMAGFNNGNSLAAGASTTLRATGSRQGIFDSNAAVTPAGSKTLTFTGANDSHGHIIVSLAPAGGGAVAFTPRIMVY